MKNSTKPRHLFVKRAGFAVLFLGLFAILFSSFARFAQVEAAGTITGTVFFDYNDNGVINTGSATLANDNGVAGVTVTAFNSGGVASGTTTTGAAGTYSLTATGTGPYRIEFTNLPAGFFASATGANNGTTVQFVPDGNSTGINLGVVNNTIYSQDNPNIASPILVSGNPLGGGNSGTAAWMAIFPYNSSGTTAIPQTFNGTVLGATWGQAYQRQTRRLYSSALVKRHVGLGSFQTDGSNGGTYTASGFSGTGGIYVINFAAATPAPAQFVNLQSLGIDTGDFTAARNLPAASGTPSVDPLAFAAVGKLGIGDIDLSEDGNTLWAVNLNTRALVSMNVTGGVAPTAATQYNVISTVPGAPTCTNGVLRPWALSFRNSLGYLGAVCSGENETTNTTANLRAYVLSFNPANPNAGFTTVLNIPLNYTRGAAANRAVNINVWFPWTDTYSDAAFRSATPISDNGAGGLVVVRPTPILSDIEFDNNGAMILGFTDRAGNQLGDGHPRPNGTDQSALAPATGGEILRAQSNGTGGYTLENNGSVTGFTGAGVGNNQGPGGGEFYANDNLGGDHSETGQGGLAQLYGGDLATTELDPTDFRTGGIGWMTNTNGANPRDYQLFSGAIPNFGKANGLGDIELLSNPAPIEIGNRVWRDTDGNGIQDPDEAALGGVTVRLYNASNAVVGTAVTNAAGQYYFVSATTADANTGDNVGQVNGGIQPNSGYQVRFDLAANYAAGGVLNNLVATAPNAVGQMGIDDLNDSDAVNVLNPTNSPAGRYPVIPVTTGFYGANNHSLDVGFSSTVSIGSTVFNDPNNNGVQNTGEAGIGGVTVELLYDADNNGVIDGTELTTAFATQTTTTTGTVGNYFFNNLTPGNYQVRIPTPPATATLSSTVAATTDNQTDSNDDGVQTGGAGGSTISPLINLLPGAEPTTTETGQGGTQDDTAPNVDANGDMTVDFGFLAPASVGNLLFNDANGNGVQDANELGINGITVTLYDAAGNPITTTTTTTVGGVAGQYSFVGLAPGTYSVGFGTPAGFTFSPQDQGGNDALDSDAGTTGRTANFTLVAGQNNNDIDAGVLQTVTLGNRIFNDLNNNGLYDPATEAGIPGVIVRLYLDAGGDGTADGGVLLTATTDANGLYSFSGLAPNTYIVAVVTPAGFTSSFVNGGDPDNNTDNDDNGVITLGVETRSNPVTLALTTEPTGETPTDTTTPDNSSNFTVDFGFFQSYSLGNRVFNDVNNDGLRAATGEPGIAGVTVRLLTAAGADVDSDPNTAGVQPTTTVTDANGYYRFDNLVAGTYVVQIDAANFAAGQPLAALASSNGAGQEATPDTNADNNDNGIDAKVLGAIRSGTVTLGPNGGEPTGEADTVGGVNPQGTPNDAFANMTVDFGFTAEVALGNRIFNDLNNSGTLDGAEVGIANVVVNLYAANGTTLIATATSDATGFYAFKNIAPGDYIIELAAANFNTGGVLAGFRSSTGVNNAFEGIATPDVDAAATDSDDNGTTTGVLGAGGVVRTLAVTLTVGGEPTGENNGGTVTTTDNAANLTADFGVFQTYSLGNRVFNDVNNDGTRAATGEAGIANVVVRLLTSAGADVDSDPNTAGVQATTATTDDAGYYRFDGLTAGSYIVQVEAANFAAGQPLAALASSSGAGQEAAPDSNADNNDNGLDVKVAGAIRSGTVTLGPNGGEPVGETDLSGTGEGVANSAFGNMTVDFGFTAETAVGNRIFNDVNNNGVLDGAETGITGVVINIYAADGTTLLGTTTTDANGFYAFRSLSPGDYILELAAANFNTGGVLAGFRSSTGVNNAFEGTTTPDVDAVATDLDDNGTTTGTLGAGGVVRTLPITLTAGGEPVGENNGGTVTTTDNAANLTADFGVFQSYSLGNRVFNDVNNNGTRDAGDNGIANVVVRLLTAAGADIDSDPNTAGVQPTTTTTDANGYYRFDGLGAGDYAVQIDAANFNAGQPLAALASSNGAGQEANANLNADNNDNGIDAKVAGAIRSGTITLGGGAEPAGETDLSGTGEGVANSAFGNMTVDFGFTPEVALGSRIFNDVNNSGTLDGAETGIAGVVVNLYAADGVTLIATTTTDANGFYVFKNLAPGDYIVELAAVNFNTGGALAGFQSSSGVNNANEGAATPDVDANTAVLDDNGTTTGTLGAGGVIRTLPVTLTVGGEPTAEAGGGTVTTTDNAANLTAGFGLLQSYSLGNRIFNDVNNNGTRDAGDNGIVNVVVRLLTAAGADIDSDPNTAGVQPTTRTTDANGYYRFDNLAAGGYIVQVDAANFAAGQPLNLLATSTGAGQEATPDSNVDSNDNGLDTKVAGAIRSGTVTLGGGAEPTNDTGDLSGTGEGVANSAFGNMTVDFGFTASYSIGNRIFRDFNNNAQRDAGDTGISGATVRLLNAAGTVVLATTTSDANGYYRFDNVAPGDYIVEVVNPAGLQSSTGSGGDPDTNLSDTDNNGEVRITGAVRTMVFTIGADAEPTGETDLGTGAQGGVADNRGNMTIDFGFQNISTAVTLVSFESTAYNNGVMLEWQTGYEVGNLGFNIYRERGGKRELVNPELIAGSAFIGGANTESKSGFAYNWFDAAGSADALYFIEDLGVDGKSSASETAIQKAAVSENSNENANARLLSDLSTENNAQSEVFAAEIVKAKAAGDVNRKGRTVTVNALANEAAVKLAVKQTGWQRVERAALTAAGLPETAQPTTYQLFADGKEQALRVNSDNSIEFYGTAAASVLSDAHVYWLTWNKTIGKRLTAVDGTNVENAQSGSFRSTIERRDNSIYVPSVLNGDRENFFDAVILNQAVRQNVNLRSLDAANNIGSLEVDFQGFTVNTAHSVRIDINGSSIGVAEFNSTERKTLRFAIDLNILRDGANEVSFVEQNGEGNVSLVEAFRITYAKRYRADNGKLTFSPAANQPILVEGFASANVRVVDVTDAANPIEIQVSTEQTADGFAARVPAVIAKHTLVAFAADAVQTAPTAIANNPSDLRGFKDGAAFVILTHGDFQTAAERLAEARRAGGLSTVVVNVADVYDEYNFGAANTAGVREFLANAAATWTIKPQYLLLMGDTSADTRNYLGHNNNFVPTQFFESSNLEASGDDLLSDFNNDGMADLSTGRLPVRTAAQADAVVNKLLAYENGSSDNVKANGALLVADEGFEAMNNELGATIENRMSITNINRVDGNTGEIRQRILDGINSGARIVSYAGHGSNRIWSSNQMFKAADAANLTNGENLSLFVNLTCYNGFVADPTVESLGEALINNERGGAFAVWASSGMTFANEQALIGKAFYDQIVNNPKTRIGDAARTAKQATNDQDVRRTWTLLGDPTMRLR